MSEPQPRSGVVLRTLLLSDLVGSTRLVEQVGDERAFAIFTRHDRLARDLLRRFHGHEIDKTDGFLHLFERPIDAVLYALAYHRALAALAAEETVQLESRVGIHLGEVHLRANSPEDVARGAKPLEVEGLAKPIAARMMSLAQGRQTLLSQTAFDVARRAAADLDESGPRLAWLAHGFYTFAGIEEPVPVFEVGVEGLSVLAPPPDSHKAQRVVGDPTIAGWRPATGLEVPHRRHWHLARKLGEGGYGEVWLATHSTTRENRVFKFCFESERLRGLRREVTLFRLLRETLGNRDDITRILDWSFDEPPYFLESEYTEGGSLGDWLEHQGGVAQVPLATRLELVAQAAQALAAAHSVGILHKDVKPANILVAVDGGGSPRARLTDFGIGLLADRQGLVDHGITVSGLTEELSATDGSTSGTLLYMAPELMAGQPPTVQADIFALGVVLFQLVVGNLNRAMGPGWERDVDDELLREDIAALVDASPDRRLADAAEVARRLRSLGERRQRREAERAERAEMERARIALARATRRRRVTLAVGAALVLFAAAMTIQARRIAAEARRANREAATAREVSRFLVEVFEVNDRNRGASVTARELLDQAASKVAHELAGDPLTQARLMDSMGNAYLGLGLWGEAQPLLQQAADSRRQLLGEESLETAASLHSLGLLATRQGRLQEAQPLLERSLELREKLLGPTHSEVALSLTALAELHRARGAFDAALPLERRAEAIRRAAGGPAAATAGPPGATSEPVALARTLDLPPDVVQVMAAAPQGELAVAASSRGIALLDLDARAAPVTTPLGLGEELLCVLGDGTAIVRAGRRLLARVLLAGDRPPPDRVLVDDLEGDEGIAVSRSGRRLARFSLGRVRALDLDSQPPRTLRELRPSKRPHRVTLSDRFLAWSEGEVVRAVSLADGRQLLERHDWEGSVSDLALDDASAQLAVGGWFDEVAVYDLTGARPVELFKLPGQTGRLLFLDDYPTLAVGKEGRVALWRRDSGVFWKLEDPGARFAVVGFGGSGLLVEDVARRRLLAFAYNSFPLKRRVKVSARPIWATAVDPASDSVFLGAADGQLHRYDVGADSLRSVAAHSQGVTALLVRGSEVISGADDKTIARWNAATLERLAEGKAHRFLVNFLFFEEATGRLWSSSQDGTVKAWSWPQLEELEVIAAGPEPKAAIFVDSVRGLALVGTWAGSWLELHRGSGAWTVARRQDTGSAGVYSVVELPRQRVVVLLGVGPTSLWLYDLDRGQAWPLPHPDLTLGWLLAAGDDLLLAVGDNCAAAYRFERQGGSLTYTVSVGLSTDAGDLGVASVLPNGLIAAGSATGELVLFDAADLPKAVLMRGVVGEGR